MQEHLLRKLISKNYFKVGTEVTASHKGMDLCGVSMHLVKTTFTVTRIVETVKGNLRLELISVVDGHRIRILPDAISMIDGMTPERFAENYLIATDGSDIKVEGKRRGRRPNNWVNPELTIADDAETTVGNFL